MFDKFEYSKDWRNPVDFPTMETDEQKVRADMQLLFTEAKNAIWALVDALAAKSAAANIHGANKDNESVSLQSLLTKFDEHDHTHADLTALEALVSALAGVTLADSITDDPAKVPSAKAVFDYIVYQGGGDMMSSVYDPEARRTDVFKYTDDAVAAHSEATGNVHHLTKGDIGLGNVDNTSDQNKPISVAVQKALDGKASNTEVIPIARGGLGTSTLASARTVLQINNVNNTSDANKPLSTAAKNANTALQNSINSLQSSLNSTSAAVASKMPSAGGTFSGPVTFHRMLLTSEDYGNTLPTTNLTVGRLFFKKV